MEENQNYEVEVEDTVDTTEEVEGKSSNVLGTLIKVGAGIGIGLAVPKIIGVAKKGFKKVKNNINKRKGKKAYAKAKAVDAEIIDDDEYEEASNK